MSRRSKLIFSPAKVTLIGMSGLAIVLNTGDAPFPVLLYSGLSCACTMVDEATSSTAINMILFMLYFLSLIINHS